MTTRQKYIDYSQLFSQLIDEEDEMNETVVSFLYHLFPNELFVRGISVLESGNMFIYVLEKDGKELHSNSSSSTDNDAPSVSTAEASKPSSTSLNDIFQSSHTKEKSLVEKLYTEPHSLTYRLIVKQEELKSPPIYVDLPHWFCSCDEFNELFKREMLENEEPSLYSQAVFELIDESEHLEDKFGLLAPRSGHQRFFRHELVMCPHLLAFGLILETRPAMLRYFIEKRSQVFLITIQNVDEWLKLHLNIVV